MDSSCRASLASTGCDEYRRRVVNAEINSSSVDLQALVSSANDVAFTSSQAERIVHGTFNNILNVMGNSRNEMSALGGQL